MAWDRVKKLFVQTDEKPEEAASLDAELEQFALPTGTPGADLPEGATPQTLTGQIDFQGLYDQAGIPNTDEVEALEKFLAGLDETLPQASKIAAAKAFLGAIGKSPNDVVTDATRKIKVVRAVEEAKRTDTDKATQGELAAIEALQQQIETHRAQMESTQKDLESVRSQCAVEEARLQGARVFFGVMATDPPGVPGKKK